MVLFVVTMFASKAVSTMPTSEGLTARHPQLKHRLASVSISLKLRPGVSSTSKLLARSDTGNSGIRTRGAVSRETLLKVGPVPPALADGWLPLNERSIRLAAALPEATD